MSFGFDATYLGLWVLVIVQGLILLGLARKSVELERQVAERDAAGASDRRLQLGTSAPDFTAEEVWSGRAVRREDLAGSKHLLLFLSGSCRVCEDLAGELQGAYQKAAGHLLTIWRGDRAECRRFLERRGIRLPVLLDEDLGLSRKFRVDGSPLAVMLDEQVRVRAYGYPRRGVEVEELFAQPFPELPEELAERPQEARSA
jgi:peroxiredoxin